jgi:DNA polymerase III epsilon subunit family exonuclease
MRSERTVRRGVWEHGMSEASRAFSEGEFVAFDLETTGLFAGSCRIVEVAAVRFRGDGVELGRMERLVDPGGPIPWRATMVHRITDAMVRNQPRISEVLPEFLEFLGHGETILLAHNAAFDVGFLAADLTRLRLSAPPHAVMDTLSLARRRLPRLPNHRLETVAAYFRVAGGKHRALADSLTVKETFLQMVSLPPAVGAWSELQRLAPLRYFQQPPAPDAPQPEDALSQAIQGGQRITIIYEGGTKGATERPVTPKAIIRTRGVSYLVAFCHLDAIEKTYRLDRIRKVQAE